MIFPKVSLSQLKSDVQIKKASLDESAGQLKSSLADMKNPLNLIKKHPLLFLGGIGSSVAALTATVKTLNKGKWFKYLTSLAGTYVLRRVFPLLADGVAGILSHSRKGKKSA
ncbi:MAG: hypothetical protein KCHDKBKB_01519 [Elusimicrobia bacterium]|nr:hypothetical protein [Elusimicrobiota bacterium]